MNKMIFGLALAMALTGSTCVLAACPPDGYSRQDLLDIRAAQFEVDEASRDSLAVALLACLSDPDPVIRDGVVYEGLATWLRGDLLGDATIESLAGRLVADLSSDDDPNGFLQPFAALVLSEVVRTDRIGMVVFTPQRRAELVNATSAFMRNIADYRGFSDSDGWRHSVAHGSDLVLQLVLNENIDADQVEQLVNATLSQVAPPGTVAYVHGESTRLARAVFYAHSRGVIESARWQVWLDEVIDPAPLATWGDAFSSEAGLAQRHNTLVFLMALHVYAAASGSDSAAVFEDQVMGVLKEIW